MSQSMQYLRKNQKVILAVTGVVCIVTFTVGSFILQWVDSSARGTGGETTVVKWTNGRVTEKDMSHMLKSHMLASQAVRALAMTAMQKGALPHGLGVNVQSGQLGILAGDSEENVVQIMLLAAKAKSLGISIDDATVRQFLGGLAGAPESGMKDGDIKQVLHDALGDRMTITQFFEQMKTELLARYMLTLVGTGLDTLPPSEMFAYYERLNRQATIESFPVKVADFVDKVTGKPTPAQLRDLFNAHKNELVNPNLAGPRFKQPRQIAVQYVKADFAKLVEEEKAKITEEAIKAEYEKRVADGQFKVPVLPEVPMTDPTAPKPEEGGEKKEETKPEEKPTEEKPAETPKTEEKQPDAPPAEEKKADEPKTEEAKPDEAKPEEKPAEPKPDSSALANGEVFVLAQDEAAPAEEKKAEEKKADETPAAEPAAEKKADEKPADAAQPAAEPKPQEPATTPPADSTQPPAQPPATAAPAEPAMTVQPLEKVRDQILLSLAREPAQKRMDAAFTVVRNAVLKHGRQIQVARSLAKTEKEASEIGKEPFDVAAVAKEAGLEYGSIPLSNEFQLAEHELGRTTIRGGGQFGNSIPFTLVAFNPQHPLFAPQQVNSTIGDTEFVFWNTEAKPEEVPTFEAAHDQVVEAWKFAEAIKLAREAAEKLAKEGANAKSLKEAFIDRTVTESKPFSWLTSGFTPFGMGQPRLSEVAGVELAGTEFMRAVFSLKPGQVGVAPNQPESIFYVVRLTTFIPDEKLLREMFTGGGLPGAAQRVLQGVAMVAQEDHGVLLYDWYQDLLKEYGVEWQRDPNVYDSQS